MTKGPVLMAGRHAPIRPGFFVPAPRGKMLVILEAFLLAAVFVTFTPMSLLGNFRPWNIPLLTFIWMPFLLVSSGMLFFRKTRGKVTYFAGAAVMMYMATVGLLRNQHQFFNVEDFLRDVLFASGFLGGVAWGQLNPEHSAVKFEFRLASLAVASLLLVDLGVRFGLIASVVIAERVPEPAQYSSSYFVMALLPIIWTAPRVLPAFQFGPWRVGSQQALVYAGVGAVIIFSVTSITRSTVILLLVSIMLTVWASAKRARLVVAVLVLLAAAMAQFASGGGRINIARFGLIGERFTLLQDTREEVRFQEVEDLMSQMDSSELFYGKGFGIGFLSVVAGESRLATALNPHVGILAFLQKGGIPMMILAILPLIYCISKLISFRAPPYILALYGSIIFYYVCASMSGGWYIMPFFLVGYMASRLCTLRDGGPRGMVSLR